MKRALSTFMFVLLLVNTLTFAFNTQNVKASGTIYIRADGSIDPPTAPMQRNSGSVFSASLSTEWNRTYGGTGWDWGQSVVQTSDGGYAVAGYTTSFGTGGWLVKTDSAGNMQWNKTYGGTSFRFLYSLVQTSDGGYALAGATDSFGAGNHDFWLVKTDSAGNMQWNKTYGGTSHEEASSVVQTSDGGYALAGDTNSFGAGSDDFWLVKTDSAGNMQWNKTYGGTGPDLANALVQTGDGGYALAGSTSSYGAGSGDFWLVKTDSAGNMQWNMTYGGTSHEEAYSLVQTSDGGYAVAGYTGDFWLVKTDSAGNMQWNMTYGGTGYEEAWSVVQTSDGGYALAGYTNSFGAGNPDFWLVKTDSAGNMQWNMTYGGTGYDMAFSVVQTSDGGYALAGATDSFGAGDDDFWLIKIAPEGVRDIALANMTPSKTVVGQGHSTSINVTIENRGAYTETFNVTAYANTTTIATLTDITLTSGNSTTLTFTWNTTGFALGNYTISAYAWPVQGETSTGDNTLSDGTVIVSHVGDITGDGKVDIQDLARVSAAYGSLLVTDPLDPRYGQYWHPVACSTCPHTPNADITNDGKVDIQDLARTSGNFGWHQ